MKRLLQCMLVAFACLSPAFAEDRQILCTIESPKFYKPWGNAPSLSFAYKLSSEMTTLLKAPVAFMYMLIEKENGTRLWARIATSKKGSTISANSTGTPETRSNREPEIHIKSVRDNFVKWPTANHGSYNRRILSEPLENAKVILWRIEIWSAGSILGSQNSYTEEELTALSLPADWYEFRKHASKIEYNSKNGEYKMPAK